MVDVIEVLTDSADPRQYLEKLRKREAELDGYVRTNCTGVDFKGSTGKTRKYLLPGSGDGQNSRRRGRPPVSKLEPGDIIFIKNGELVPADGILLKGRARVDYSFVTGEAAPVEVASGFSRAANRSAAPSKSRSPAASTKVT